MTKTKNVRPFLVLLLCFLLQGGTLGILSNCRGIFSAPVCAELGFALGGLNSYSVFYGLAVCAAIPFAAKLVRKGNLRVLLAASGLAAAAAEYAMASFQRLYQWYVAAAVQGAAYAFLVVLTVPMLINNWFASNKGTFLGISSISSGLVGALMNSLAGRIIAEYGWRAGYRFLGVTLFALLVPASLLCAWRSPETVGARPYGIQDGAPAQAARGMSARQARQTPSFYLLLLYACVICCTVGYNQTLASMAGDLGYPLGSVSGFVSVAMLGTILFKVLIGRVIDRHGVWVACFLATGGIAAGFVVLLFGASPAAMYAGSLLMGMPMAVSVVLIQAMVRAMFGGLEFEGIYSAISVAINLASNFSFSLIGWIVSLSGSYRVSVYAGLGIAGGAFVVAVTLYVFSKKGVLSHERSD